MGDMFLSHLVTVPTSHGPKHCSLCFSKGKHGSCGFGILAGDTAVDAAPTPHL